MKIAISAESTIDMPQTLLDKYEIHTIPFYISMGDELIKDEEGISARIFEYVEKNKKLPTTSAVNQNEFKEYFEELKNDYDAIIHISLSSHMSSAYANACNIAKDMENVFIIDSKSLSTGIGLLAIAGHNLIKEGKTAQEIVNILNDKTAQVQAGFVLEKLQYLYKGGRCSTLAMLGANILKIKPQIQVTNGKMGMAKKFMGPFAKCVDKYCDALFEQYKNPDLNYVFITHSSNMPEIVNSLKTKLQAKGFKNIYDTFANGTISSHCGPNCIGVLFVEENK